MWNLYGKKYDLTKFAKFHPGGAEIIEKTKGIKDCTPLFESYHAFSDINSIKNTLEKYIQEGEGEQTFDFTLYYTLLEKVKKIFPDRNSIKAPPSWYLWNSIVLYFYLCGIFYMFSTKLIVLKAILSIFVASLEISLLFNLLHEGCHYAISTNPIVNTSISKITNSWVLWNHSLWFYRHVYSHHSFTRSNNDPDENLYNISIKNKYIFHFLYSVLPGQFNMNSLWYFYNMFSNNKIDIPPAKHYDEISIAIMFARLLFFYKLKYISMVYIITCNSLYYINIISNHHLYETNENLYDGNDWVKRQICNSGNCMNSYPWWTVAFSGINHQIEHHLFPNVCGHHHIILSKIVKDFCKENNISYVHHDSISNVYKSFMKRIQ